MAKTKVDAPTVMESKPTLSLYDLEGEAPDLAVGDKVRLTVTGKVKSIEERESYDKKGKVVHCITMERLDVKVVPLSEADDMDMDEYVKWRKKK